MCKIRCGKIYPALQGLSGAGGRKNESAPHRMRIRAPVGLEHPVSAQAQGGGLETLQSLQTLRLLLMAGGLVSVSVLNHTLHLHMSQPSSPFPLTVTMRILKSVSSLSLLQILKCFAVKNDSGGRSQGRGREDIGVLELAISRV